MVRKYKRRADDPAWAALERERDKKKRAQKMARPEWVEKERVRQRALAKRLAAKERETDGGAHISWRKMIERCTRATAAAYRWYGGRGITVCERWLPSSGGSYANFLEDMGPRPEGMTIDRIDADGDYEPANCRWATQSEQNARRWGKS